MYPSLASVLSCVSHFGSEDSVVRHTFIHSNRFELVLRLGCLRDIMTLGPGPGPGLRRRGVRRTGTPRRPAGTRHLKAGGSGAIGTLEAPPLKQAVQVPPERNTRVKHGCTTRRAA